MQGFRLRTDLMHEANKQKIKRSKKKKNMRFSREKKISIELSGSEVIVNGMWLETWLIS